LFSLVIGVRRRPSPWRMPCASLDCLESIHMARSYPQHPTGADRRCPLHSQHLLAILGGLFGAGVVGAGLRSLLHGPIPRNFIVKQTFQPSRLKRARTHGFRARSATRNGRKVLQARRAKGRARLAL